MEIKRNVIAVIIIIVLGIVVYANSTTGKFLWDDSYLIENNKYIKSWDYLPKLFTENIASGAGLNYRFYRPLQMVSYLIDHSIWGLKEIGFHISNTLFHIIASLCLYWLVLVLYKDKLLSLFCSLFFVIHPIHTEAVSYISGRSDSLALIFLALTFIYYIKSLEQNKLLLLLLSEICFILALFSRENTLILPCLLLLYHFSFRKKINWTAFTLLLITAIGYIFLRSSLFPDIMPQHETGVLIQAQSNLPGFFNAIVTYIRLLIFPFNLHMEYGLQTFQFTNLQTIFGILVTISLLFFAFYKKRSYQLFSFAILWFFICLLPVANIYPINAYLAEHWLYLPSLGFFLIAAKIFTLLLRKKNIATPTLIALTIVVTMYSLLTIRQNNYWQKPIQFYQRTLKFSPDSFRILSNLAILYQKNSDMEMAEAYYKKAIAVNPLYAKGYNDLGLLYRDTDDFEQAIRYCKKAIEVNPFYMDAYLDLGTAYELIGDNKQAIYIYRTAIKVDSSQIAIYQRLANILSKQNEIEESINLYQEALKIDSENIQIWNNLAIAYSKSGKTEKAISVLNKIIELDPQLPGTYINLGNIYYQQGKIKKAKKMYEQSIAADPTYPLPYYNLARIAYEEKEYELAVQYGEQAEKLDYKNPGLTDLLEVLAPYRMEK